MSVKAVSVLRTSSSVSADIVLLLHTRLSIAGGLIANGAVATSITGLRKTQEGNSSWCYLICQTAHSFISPLIDKPRHFAH